MRKPVAISLTFLLGALLVGCSPRASQPGGPAVAPGLPVLSAASFASGEAFEALPPGDLLMTIDAGALVNQTIPMALVNSPDEKTKFDKSLVEMQEKSGIDPKQLKLVAMSFSNLSGGKPTFAGVMTGTFDTAKLSESLKKDPKTGTEALVEQYNGQTLYTRKDGTTEFASAVLDAGTLVLASSATLAKAAIDAHAGKAENATKDVALFDAFKATDSAAVLRFAMKFPKDQIPADQVAKDPTAKAVSAINYVTGSLNATAGLGIRLTAKTGSAADAQPLHDTLAKWIESGKQMFGGSPQGKSVVSILNSTTVAVNGSDVNLAMNIPADQLAAIAEDFKQMGGAAFGGAGAGAAPGSTPPDGEDEDKDQ